MVVYHASGSFDGRHSLSTDTEPSRYQLFDQSFEIVENEYMYKVVVTDQQQRTVHNVGILGMWSGMPHQRFDLRAHDRQYNDKVSTGSD